MSFDERTEFVHYHYRVVLGQGRRMKVFTLLIILLSFSLLGCTKSAQPSVLLILTDDLSFSDAPCSTMLENEKQQGLATLCNESVRFTHAYSPSPMAVPTIATIFTGIYPYDHGAQNNGSYLRPEIETIPEKYLERGYRTAFFSGGAPVLRKTGLNQGFEVFDDLVHPTVKKLFRPFKASVDLSLKWINENKGRPFFVTIYAPDLIFTNTLTSDETGELRNFSYESQLEEFNFQLQRLITELKKHNQWDNTHVILAGLNGQTEATRETEISPLNLHSENLQVTLFVKPAGKTRDLGIAWKFDKNISLADIGTTLLDWIGERKRLPIQSPFETFSLKPVFDGKSLNFPNERPILLESAWSTWRYEERIRYGVIRGFNFLINDYPPKQYNTLVDRFETSPLAVNENFYLENSDTFKRLNGISAKAWNTRYPKMALKYKIPFQRWMRNDQTSLLQKDLQSLYADTQDLEVANWLAFAVIQNKDWQTLLRLGMRNENSMWITAASDLLNQELPKNVVPDHCFRLLTKKDLETKDLKTCTDREFIELISWVRADDLRLNPDRQKLNFIRNYWYGRINKTVARANIAMASILDTNPQNSLKPHRSDLALNLEQMKKYRVDLNIELDKLDQSIESTIIED